MLHIQLVSLFQLCRTILRRGFTRSNKGDFNFFFSLRPRKAASTQPAARNSLLWRSNGGLGGASSNLLSPALLKFQIPGFVLSKSTVEAAAFPPPFQKQREKPPWKVYECCLMPNKPQGLDALTAAPQPPPTKAQGDYPGQLLL